MIRNFTLFSDLQKRVSTSPIKTWRLLKQMRDEGRMKADQDWQMLDRKLFVNVPRFIAELEGLGYENMKSDDFKNDNLKSDEITKLAEEIKLISSEITESRIQEEMKSLDIMNSQHTEEVKSSEINYENSKPTMDGISPTMKSGEINLRFEEFKLISDEIMESHLMKSKDEIIRSKDEMIELLKRDVKSKETDISQLRNTVETLSQQTQILTRQNAWLTNLIAAPKHHGDSVKSDEIIYENPHEPREQEGPIETDHVADTQDATPEERKEPAEPSTGS